MKSESAKNVNYPTVIFISIYYTRHFYFAEKKIFRKFQRDLKMLFAIIIFSLFKNTVVSEIIYNQYSLVYAPQYYQLSYTDCLSMCLSVPNCPAVSYCSSGNVVSCLVATCGNVLLVEASFCKTILLGKNITSTKESRIKTCSKLNDLTTLCHMCIYCSARV